MKWHQWTSLQGHDGQNWPSTAHWKSTILSTERKFYEKYQIDQIKIIIKSNKESAKLTKNYTCLKNPASRHSHCEKISQPISTANQMTGFYTVRTSTEEICQAGWLFCGEAQNYKMDNSVTLFLVKPFLHTPWFFDYHRSQGGAWKSRFSNIGFYVQRVSLRLVSM